MPKTGCSHIARLLTKFDGGSVTGQHQPFSDISKRDGRVISISCRNPWDWYVSLWAQGCRTKGRLGDLYYALAYSPIDDLKRRLRQLDLYASARSAARIMTKGIGDSAIQRRFQSLYVDVYSEHNFREWLSLLMNDCDSIRYLPNGYFESESHNSIGYMTHTFLRLSTEYSSWNSAGRHSTSIDQVREFMERNSIIDRFITMENLNVGVRDLLGSVGIRVEIDDLVMKKVNSSAHKDYRHYYNEAAFLQVRQAESLLVEKFMYSF